MPGHNFWVIFLLLVYRNLINLGKPPDKKSAVFFNIVQKAFDPPPFRLNIYVVNFSEGILTKVHKRLSKQLSTK